LNTDSVVNLLSKQFLLKESTSINLNNETVTELHDDNVMTEERTLLWNSKRPWNVYSSLSVIEKNMMIDNSATKDKKKTPVNFDMKALTQEEVEHAKLNKNDSWTSKLQKNKNRKVDKTFLSSILLTDITKKPAITNGNNSDSTMKVTFRNPYSFTSYLQDLLEE
jgi:hypothetical protein